MPMSRQLFLRLEDVQTAGAADKFGDVFERAIADFGGLAFAIGVIKSNEKPILRQERGLERWLDYYHESGLVEGCAFSQRTITSHQDFTWDEEIADEGERTYVVAAAAESYGLRHGLHVPVLTRGGFHGCVFMQTERADLEPEVRLSLNLLALAAHARLEELESPGEASGETLSPREREVLLWFAEGKSAEDVGRIVGISPATVMYHYRSVADRYGTLNRTHTVVEAMRRGVLSL
jgi:LuxR family quorum sensing-dependent transcriptional regulator